MLESNGSVGVVLPMLVLRSLMMMLMMMMMLIVSVSMGKELVCWAPSCPSTGR